jgi:hypothetical protein
MCSILYDHNEWLFVSKLRWNHHSTFSFVLLFPSHSIVQCIYHTHVPIIPMCSNLYDHYEWLFVSKLRWNHHSTFSFVLLFPLHCLYHTHVLTCMCSNLYDHYEWLFMSKLRWNHHIAEFAKCVSPVRHDQQNLGRFW